MGSIVPQPEHRASTPARSAWDVITASILTRLDVSPAIAREVASDVISDVFHHGHLIVRPQDIDLLHAIAHIEDGA